MSTDEIQMFHEWLEERITWPLQTVSKLPELPSGPDFEDIHVVRESYNKARNDLNMLRAFVSIILEKPEDQITINDLKEHVCHLEDIRAKLAVTYMKERDQALDEVRKLKRLIQDIAGIILDTENSIL